MRHLGSMPEESGSRYKFPAFKVNAGNELIGKARKVELPF